MLASSNKLLTVILLTTAVAIVGYTGTRGQSPQAPQNVLVTNSTTQAVPVKNGSTPFNVTVANSIGQPMPVKQSGSWYVGLSGVPNIHVANSSSQPVPTTNRDEEGRNVFAYPINSFIPYNQGSATEYLPAVPSGQRLIITHVSALCGASNGDLPPGFISLFNIPGGGGGSHTLCCPLNGVLNEPGSSDGSVDCFFPVNHGDTDAISVARPPTSSTGFAMQFLVEVQGYFVSVP